MILIVLTFIGALRFSSSQANGGSLLFAPLAASEASQPQLAQQTASINVPSGAFTFSQIQAPAAGGPAFIPQQSLVQQPLFIQTSFAQKFPLQALPATVPSSANNNNDNLSSGGGGGLLQYAL